MVLVGLFDILMGNNYDLISADVLRDCQLHAYYSHVKPSPKEMGERQRKNRTDKSQRKTNNPTILYVLPAKFRFILCLR